MDFSIKFDKPLVNAISSPSAGAKANKKAPHGEGREEGMKLPLEGIKEIYLNCDGSGYTTLAFFYEEGSGGKIIRPGDKVIFSGAAPSVGKPTDAEEPQPFSLEGMADSLRTIQAILERWEAEKKEKSKAWIEANRPYRPK